MRPPQVVVGGALTPDGELVLDEKPNLPPGRVQVVVRLAEERRAPAGSLFAVLERIWADQAARGFHGTSCEEIMAHLNALRDEWDEGRDISPQAGGDR